MSRFSPAWQYRYFAPIVASFLLLAAVAFAVRFEGHLWERLFPFVDALALGCWAAVGAQKTLMLGLGWLPAILLGTVTAVGGGAVGCGHAGDGNFHPLVVFDHDDPKATKRAEVAFGEVMDLALTLGGVVTGEHGIGTLKLPWVAAQLGDDVVELSRRIKQALDPLGILNPGKAI